jgi:type I restriction enzyme S subunit
VTLVNGEWEEVCLGDICTFKYGKALPQTLRSGGDVPVYGSNGVVGQHDSAITTGETIVIGRKGSFGEVNFSAGPCWPIDTAYFVDGSATDQDIRWLSYRLTDLGLNQLNKAAAVPGLNREDAYRQKLLLPPIVEQRRIADILDQADALRAKRREALAQLDSLTQSIFIEMFGDPVANSMKWPVKKFGEVGTLDRGVSKHRPRNAPELLGGDHPLVQTGEVSNCDGYIRTYKNTYSDIGLKQSKMWPLGTLCITIAANIAKTGILTFDACFPDSVVGFRADNPATVEYVRVWLSFLQKALEDAAPESAQKNINLAILRGLSIPVPPLSIQQTFATRIQSVEALKATHNAALQELDRLFASLQYRAFQGEL